MIHYDCSPPTACASATDDNRRLAGGGLISAGVLRGRGYFTEENFLKTPYGGSGICGAAGLSGQLHQTAEHHPSPTAGWWGPHGGAIPAWLFRLMHPWPGVSDPIAGYRYALFGHDGV